MKSRVLKYLPVFISVFFVGTIMVAFAQVETGLGKIDPPTGDDDVFDFINRMTRLIQPAVAIAFLFVIVYGGFTRMTAAGDPEKEKKSMQILTAGIAGFIIIVMAQFVVELITSVLGIENAIE